MSVIHEKNLFFGLSLLVSERTENIYRLFKTASLILLLTDDKKH